MKRKLLFALLFSFSFCFLFSQVPQGFNYQAIAKEGDTPITTTLPVRITIQSDPGGGTIFWQEEHSSVTPNASGLFSLVVGMGTRTAGLDNFGDIDWTISPKYIKTEINYGGWQNMGSSALWTVPYSMVAGELGGALEKLKVNGKTASLDSALFEVKNNNGQTIFAVYNEGVRVYVDDGAKGAKGGFSIGGFGTAKAGESQDLLIISPDSARIYVDETAAKGAKGGFSIGGFNSAKGTVTDFMMLTPENYFIGHKSGQLIQGGIYNATLGYESGLNLVNGSNNVFIGYQSGLSTSSGGSNVFVGTKAGNLNEAGYYNIFLGRQAGYNNTASSNIYLGDLTGWANTTGYQNVMIGDWAGYYNTEGWQNVFLGAEAGWNNTVGNYNNFMGFESGYQNISGSYNSFIGYKAGYNNTTGEKNTYLGYQAGYSGVSASGSNNIFMGVEAGYSNIGGYDNIAIGNKAGRSNVDGTYNIMIGSDAGSMNVSGHYNTLIGYKAGENTTNFYGTMLGYLAGNESVSGPSQTLVGYEAGQKNTGSYNTLLGVLAGGNSGSGSFNTYLGIAAGNEAPGSNNVFIGKWSGWNEQGSDKLVIENNYSDVDNYNNALIYGDFATDLLKVNGQIINSVNKSGYAADFKNSGMLSSAYGLNVTAGTDDGSGTNWMIDFNTGSGSWEGSIIINNGTVQLYNVSDARLKTNITKSGMDALKLLNDLQVVDYSFIKNPGVKHTGYIAQEAKQVLPDMVIYNERADSYAISTSGLIPVLHKAIQEQQKMIESQAKRIEELENIVNTLINK